MKEGSGLSNSQILSVQELSFDFQNTGSAIPVFSQLSMNVREGEFVSIIGASGSGKSTLFKLVAGLLEPTQGRIFINGKQAEKRLGNVGYMPQKDLLMPWRTVMDNILLPLELSKENKKEKITEIKTWLSRFGLTAYEKAHPHELSGGMRQRVAFLRTIMTGKDLLLLDEPFGALDSLTKRKMHSWLLELWGDLQKTVLFITHDLEEALLLSDRIYLLSNESGVPVQEITVSLPRPRSPELIYEQSFVSMRRELEQMIHES